MITVRVGDLAESDAEAILRPVSGDWTAVTAAMRRLEMAAGDAVAEQCGRLGDLPPGSAAITGAGALNAKFMVHVVVRSREEGVSRNVVKQALLNGLRRLEEWAIESVAMPPLGTGAGNLDAEESAAVMVPTLLERMAEVAHPSEVVLYVENEYERQAFEAQLRRPGAS